MIEVTLLQALAAGGPVAILAGLMFLIYARDRKSSEDRIYADKEAIETRLTKIIEADQGTREANTRALTDLAAATRESTEVMQEVKIMLRSQRGG